jgi:hypothetical protein
MIGLPLLRPLLLALPLAFALAACEAFGEKEVPLPGARVPLFPQGVPGVDFSAPPQQPSNSNVPISSVIGEQNPDRPSAEPGAEARAQEPAPQRAQAKKGAPSRASAARTAKNAESDDPWTGTR